MNKIRFLCIILILLKVGHCEAQRKDSCLYENIKSFYNLIGYKINQSSEQELMSKIHISDLVKELNTPDIAIYKFDSPFNDLPNNIAVIEKDSIDLYDIFAINAILSRVVSLSNKYPILSKKKTDIIWIDNILKLHLVATQNVRSESWVVEMKNGRYTYHIWYNTYKQFRK